MRNHGFYETISVEIYIYVQYTYFFGGLNCVMKCNVGSLGFVH